MAKFVLLYSGGTTPTTPEMGEASMKAWTAWFEALGSAVIDAGAPFAASKTVNSSGAREGTDGNISNGYSILEAASLASAAAMVKACPIIAESGKVHIFEQMAM